MAKTRYVGFKQESAYGTEATGSTYDIDVASMGLDVPDDPNIALPTLNRFQARHIPGYYAPSGQMEYPMDIHTIGWFLKFLLGGYEYTAGVNPDPNVHEFYSMPGYDLPSFTCRVGKDTFEHVFLGTVIDKMNLTIENELATIQADMFAQKDKHTTLRTSLNEPDPDLYPMAFYNAGLTIGGSDVSADVKSFSFDYGNGVSIEDGQGLGSRFPYYIKAATGEAGIGIKLYDDSLDLVQDYWGDTAGPSESPQTPIEMVATFESGTFGTMTLTFPSTYYKKVPTEITGSDPRIPDLSVGVEAATVTLEDAVTEVFTPVYIKLENFETEYVVV